MSNWPLLPAVRHALATSSKKSSFHLLFSGTTLYVWHIASQHRFFLLSKPFEELLSLQNKTSLRSVVNSSTKAERVDTKYFELQIGTEDILQFLIFLQLDNFNFLISNYELYAECAEWNHLITCAGHSDLFSSIFVLSQSPVLQCQE